MICRSNHDKRQKETYLSLYEELGKSCYEIRKAERLEFISNSNDKDCTLYPTYVDSHDVGSGSNPRFSTSATKVFTHQELESATIKLKELCHLMSRRMLDTRTISKS